jgi:hypothetical protein
VFQLPGRGRRNWRWDRDLLEIHAARADADRPDARRAGRPGSPDRGGRRRPADDDDVAFTPTGDGATVRIETEWQPSRGITGVRERLFAARQLARVYADELSRLDDYAGLAAVIARTRDGWS